MEVLLAGRSFSFLRWCEVLIVFFLILSFSLLGTKIISEQRQLSMLLIMVCFGTWIMPIVIKKKNISILATGKMWYVEKSFAFLNFIFLLCVSLRGQHYLWLHFRIVFGRRGYPHERVVRSLGNFSSVKSN